MTQLQLANQPLSILLQITEAANSSADLHQIAEHTIELILALPSLDACGIWLHEQNSIVCLAQRGFAGQVTDALVARVIAAGEPELVDVSAQLSGPQRARSRAETLVMLPLDASAGPLGALALVTSAHVDVETQALFQAIAAYLAVAIQRIELQQLVERQRHQNEAIGRQWDEFLSLASHELKNPLASIKGYADLLLRRISKDAADPNRKGLEIISQQVGRTTLLLEQLLDISRIGMNRLWLTQESIDLLELVRRSVKEAQATTNQHRIRLDYSDAALIGSFDEVRAKQAVDAMLSNAIKYAVNGGPIVVRARRVDNAGVSEALVTVNDRGVGVPAGERELVFQRFFRGSNVRGSFAGMGLGLFIAREIATRHGGRMWIESEFERGTTCYLALPLL
jgi:signal transduction histidine kinase